MLSSFMDNLKQLTFEHHRNAERQEFVKELMSGSINDERYATYLFNQHACYRVLESMAILHDQFAGIPEVPRAKAIWEDFTELWGEHLKSIMDEPDKIMAHVYVRHMGDLSGGQMIARKVPGEGRYYKFDGDIQDIKGRFRVKLHDGLAIEAKICFDFATELFKDMTELK
jgi:heme oxygenase (biliverdin-producing, ferredoxin)